MKKKSKAKAAPEAGGTRLPQGHEAYNLPDPQGGLFQGSQLNQPGVPQAPMPLGEGEY